MSLLKTVPITVGDTTFVLSEFTALDRLVGLEFMLGLPTPKLPDDPDEAAIAHHTIAMEVRNLQLVTHTLAVSLSHANPQFKDVSIPDIQTVLKERWPNAAINEAYALVMQLNAPPAVDREHPEQEADAELIPPEKS